MAEEAERVLAAARDGDISTLQALKRSVPFASDSFGATALHHATRYGKLDCLRWMVERTGMKAKLKAKNGATPLHDACTQGKLLCVKFFIQECNLSPDVTDNSGHTPLHLAGRFGYLDIVKWLIEKAKCNPRLKTLNKMSPVHFAATGGHLKCLEYLISKLNPVVINERATDGTTPIYLAAQNGHFTCLKYLHTVGARCETKSRDGMHLIHAAAQNGHLDCVGYLVVQELAKEKERDVTGATPAHYAAGEGHVTVLRWLHKRSNLNLKDSLGGTPLHDASEKGQYKAIQFLVEVALLDTKLKDNSGMSPLDLADKYGHKQCYNYMKDASSKIHKLRAEKMSNFSQDFDTQIVEKDTGSSFLHVLKKKTKPAERPPSPKSAKGPEVSPLECSPQMTPSNSPVPPLLLYGKSTEWNDVVMDSVDGKGSKWAKKKSEVVIEYEKEDKQLRTHLLDNNNISRYSPSLPGFDGDDHVSSDVDAYSQNKENALEFDAISQEQLTEEMLNAAKIRTRKLSSQLQKGHDCCPTPVYEFDHRPGEIAARHVEEFASKIKAARSRKSPTTTFKTEDEENENIMNESDKMEEGESESPAEDITDLVDENRAALQQESFPTANLPLKTTGPQKHDSLESNSSEPRKSPTKPPESPETPVKKEKSFEVAKDSSSDEQSMDQSLSPHQDVWPNPSPHSSETEGESVIDDENYDTTTDDEKSKSLPRQKSEVKKEFVPLRKQQLIPLPHFGEASQAELKQDSLDDETWRSLPEWKRQVFKNRIMKEQSAELQKRKKEEEESRKWEGVPAWKIPIMQRKENDRMKEAEKNAQMPNWRKELAKKKQDDLNMQNQNSE